MNYVTRTIFIFAAACFAAAPLHAQRKKKATRAQAPAPRRNVETPSQPADTSAPKMVTITSAFKPFLKDAAKVNFTAATPVIDSSKIPVTYNIPSQNLFFMYQPAALKPLALPVDSGYTWENDQYIKLGAGNFSSYFGEAAFSFGDGKHSITNLRGNFLTSTGHLPAQQAAKWGIDLLSVFNTNNDHEWTAHPYYQSTRQFLYGYQPAGLGYAKDNLLQQFSTVGIEVGLQKKSPNAFGITYHPQVSAYRFFDNRDDHETGFLLKAPINKAFGRIYAFDLGITADISSAEVGVGTAKQHTQNNNLYYLEPSLQFKTPNLKLNAGIRPSWDNKAFALMPNVTAEARLSDINLVLEAGWTGSFQKNSFRSLAAYNPWIRTTGDTVLSQFSLINTKISEQYAGIKGAQGDHFTYEVKASLLKMNNLALFVNSPGDGKSFDVLYDPEVKALRLHAEAGYTEQEKISFTAGATFTNYTSLASNAKAWGLPPVEGNVSMKWKVLKDLQFKADLFAWDGAPYRNPATLQPGKSGAAADLNLGADFTVMPHLNLWLQMNNVLNSTYQRWNQYPVLGFNVLGGVVYSFR